MPLTLTLHTSPEVPLEAPCLNPDSLAGLDSDAVTGQKVMHGNREVTVGDFFKVKGKSDGNLLIEGDLSRVKYIGANMRTGSVTVAGSVGAHLGSGMSGGEIVVEGDAGDWVAPEMSGGRITIKGNAGHMVGSAHRGSAAGITGGEIVIHGDVRNEAGHAMRNGLIAVGGNSGDFTGVNMLAGTILVLGEMGIRAGAGMKRGSIISMQKAEILPTFEAACLYRPVFIRMLLLHIRNSGLEISDDQVNGYYQRWCGDTVELNRGEILLFN
ncbi:MAG: formylmethanofuran dehydrogenase subunit C, partial [Gammaproteobacteria bacterium]|nr:formylmethanofuran dehydrogenase subunit C [Gammaproteobacteria bacterium]